MHYVIGQRYASDGELELGLGIVIGADVRSLSLLFPAVDEQRTYRLPDPPLTRILFKSGDQVSVGGSKLTVRSMRSDGAHVRYLCQQADGSEREVREIELDGHLNLGHPLDRLLLGQLALPHHYALRARAINAQAQWWQSPLRGLVGARVALVPHQLHIAASGGERLQPRLLLADEVGLGKTIEAGLIIHCQLVRERASRVVVAVPEPLLHQWLVELKRRFNLRFALIDEARLATSDGNLFDDEQLVLLPQPLLRHPKVVDGLLAAGFDLLVVDEAHHLSWSPDGASADYEAVARLTAAIPGVLLLTATPDQLGHAGHFARLKLLDGDRFADYAQFRHEERQFREVATLAEALLSDGPLPAAVAARLIEMCGERDILPTLKLLEQDGEVAVGARQELLTALIDRHGTSRLMFRNRRAAISGFPGRKLHPQLLDNPYPPAPAGLPLSLLLTPERWPDAPPITTDPRLTWLLAQLAGPWLNDKVLLICAAADTAQALHQAVRERLGNVAALFHEGMTIVERDRAAAWFADPEGCSLLICSEIGSEGRNFQFARLLVLFDLPLHPDLLEQRIGRLDRIGQRHRVQIHVPVLKDSAQQQLLRWYHEGFNAFEATSGCGAALREQCAELLEQALRNPTDELLGDRLLHHCHKRHQQLATELEQGRDRLLELHSGGGGNGERLAAAIAAVDDDELHAELFHDMVDGLGIHCEVLDPGTYHLRQGGDQALVLPGIDDDGITITFDRRLALAREEVQLVTPDHPLVRDLLELFTASPQGNAAVALLVNPRLPTGTWLLDLHLLVHTRAPASSQISRFLPPTPIRLLLDAQGRNLAANVSLDKLANQWRPLDKRAARALLRAHGEAVARLTGAAPSVAAASVEAIVSAAREAMEKALCGEIDRLEALSAINPSVRPAEIAALRQQRAVLREALGAAEVSIDSLCLMVVASEEPTRR
ncbi:MAG: RNA polymerase-associated protein RapA [Gammaproteobacteria bacterium]|nr:RNA polymerase-associated protein RapA [Gammaproteobacteria bacterium]